MLHNNFEEPAEWRELISKVLVVERESRQNAPIHDHSLARGQDMPSNEYLRGFYDGVKSMSAQNN